MSDAYFKEFHAWIGSFIDNSKGVANILFPCLVPISCQQYVSGRCIVCCKEIVSLGDSIRQSHRYVLTSFGLCEVLINGVFYPSRDGT